MVAIAETRLCSRCGEHRPAGEFRLRSRGSHRRHNLCRACWAEFQRIYRNRKRDREIDRFFREAGAAESDYRHVAILAKELVRRLGGIDRCAQLLHESIECLAREKPGRRPTLCALWALFNLIQAGDQLNAVIGSRARQFGKSQS
jgi:hypothetical protein